MNEVLHANIFFVITSVAVVLLTLLVCVALYHVIKILRSIRRIVDRIDEGSETIAEDVSQLRSYVLEGSLLSQLVGFFMRQTPRRSARKKKARDASKD